MSTIHLVNHTHWDREWYLTFQQFRIKLVSLVDHLLEILDSELQYGSFLLDGQTILLEDYLQIKPERETDIRRHIKNGRIFIGPWYISPDEFLISPESHIRNLLEGDRQCRFYGGKMSVGYLPDTFGHIGQMPQILLGFGINTACLWRGLDDQPCELSWRSPDGSSLQLSYLRDSYSNAEGLAISDQERFISQVNDLVSSLSPYTSTGEILLMHGTDHMEPLGGMAPLISSYNRKDFVNNLVVSDLPHYFSSVQPRINSITGTLPVVSGELRSSKRSALLPNVLSTRITLKQRNHACETRLLKWIEPFHAWNKTFRSANSARYSSYFSSNEIASLDSMIRYAWKLLLQCHPHDSICGTSIDQVNSEMLLRFDQVDQISNELKNQLMRGITEVIDTRFPDPSAETPDDAKILSSIVVYNANDSVVTGQVDLQYKLDANYSSIEILDDQGLSIPFEYTGMGSRELIGMKLEKKAMKQAFGMIYQGNVAGFVIRDFSIVKQGSQGILQATLSDHGAVDVDIWNRGMAEMQAILADPEVEEYIVHAYSDPETEISFIARDVVPHGYCCYWIRGIREELNNGKELVSLNPIVQRLLPVLNRLNQISGISKILSSGKRKNTRKAHQIENEYFIVTVQNGADGITVFDKRTNSSYQVLNKFVDGADCGDLYNYCFPEKDEIYTAKIHSVDSELGKTRQVLRVSYQLKIPTSLSTDRKTRVDELVMIPITSRITLIPGLARIDIQTEIDNQAKDHRLRVHFPAPFQSTEAYHDGHFEIVKRPIGLPKYDRTWEEPPRPEVPQCQFSSIMEKERSMTVANRGLPEVEVYHNASGGTEIAVTLLRCIGWLSRDDLSTRKGHAGPMDVATPDAQMVGKHVFDYSIIPGEGGLVDTLHLAYSFNAPLQSMTTPLHEGVLPNRYSLLDNPDQNFIISTIKSPESGSGLIVRGFNIQSTPTDVSIHVPGYFTRAAIVKLDESPVRSIPISPQGRVNFHVEGHQIITLQLTTIPSD